MQRYHVQTLGCQMNVHDSRRIEEVLERVGYAAGKDASDADVIIVNTCSVREKAEHKLMSLLGRLRLLKELRRHVSIVVAGCVAQQEGTRLLKQAPYVDLIVGPDNIPELPVLLQALEGGAPPIVRTEFDMDAPTFLKALPRHDRAEVCAYVTVMKGCDERCTFCIVPYTRGSERYRAADDIIEEIAGLVAGGVQEVTLLGQTVNSWFEPGNKPRQKATPSSSQFAELLYRIAEEVPDLLRLRYTSPHPRHITDALIEAHAQLDVLPAHVHLPLQSGSDRLLRRMARRYSVAHYIERAKKLQNARAGLTLSTDLIVGFPGESEEDFEHTLKVVSEVGFVAAFCFKYSPRPYTPALKLGDDISEATKDERMARLLAQVERQQNQHLERLVGTTQCVLVEGLGRKESQRYTGRSGRNEIVHLDAPEGVDPSGELVEVHIKEAYKHSLHGVMPGSTPSKSKSMRKLNLLEGGIGA